MANLEKRRYPRVEANFEAEVECGNQFKIRVMVLDTSSTGLKLQCNSTEREFLTPDGAWTRNGRPIEASVTLKVPRLGRETSTVEARCAVAFSRRVAKDRYHVGLRYLQLDDASFAVLGEFISNKLSGG